MVTIQKTSVNFKTVIASEHLRNIVIPIHLLFFFSVFQMFRVAELRDFRFLPLFWILISGCGVAVGYHRLLSHRAFTTYRPIARALTIFGVMAGQGAPIAWASIHRGFHHTYSDQEGDPHTPRKGWFHAYMGWQIGLTKKNVNVRLVMDLAQDPFMRQVSLYYYLVYWGILAAAFVIDWRIALFSLVPAMMIGLHQENIINLFCHLPQLGYRNYDLPDQSVNIWILGFLQWGQGYHNNHHRFPRSYDFGVHWWEIDPCRWIVWLIADKRTTRRARAHQYSEAPQAQ